VPAPSRSPAFTTGTQVGWAAALLEIEHQAEHWETPDHGQVGSLIAQALRAAVDIARTGGLRCEHRGGAADVPETVLRVIEGTPGLASRQEPEVQPPPSAA
jgi:hypothetical protein